MSKRRYSQVPGWCAEHDDFAWLFPDGGISCFYACVVEAGSNECRGAPMPELEAADELAKAAEEAERAPYPDQQEEAQRKLVEKLAAYRRIREGEQP